MDTAPIDRPSQLAIRTLYEKQRTYAPEVALSTFRQRRDKLKRMLTYLLLHVEEIEKATYRDFRKPSAEAQLSEVISLTTELRYHIRHLRRWMEPHRVSTPVLAAGTGSYIQFEPKGTTLIIGPWNYPVSLVLKPLIAAVSAGCVAMIKPSEHTPHAAAFVKKLVSNVFTPEEVVVIEGGKDVAASLLELPFNHVFFTGSTETGKIVMKAAAAHLASVSLELGGKSPAIVDASADIPETARQLVWAKFFNNGQTCIAPDYVMVHRQVHEALLKELKENIRKMYDADGRGTRFSESYARIVNEHHFGRVKGLLEEALSEGAVVIAGGEVVDEELFIAPTVLTGVSPAMALMQEEIFGPLLPVMPFDTLKEAAGFVNTLEKPLAVYIHSRNRKNTDYLLQHTSSGNALVNEVLLQFMHAEIPFGGVNHSGLGRANGFYGFQEFSNAKGVIKRRFGTMRFLYPPYSGKTLKFLRWIRRYV